MCKDSEHIQVPAWTVHSFWHSTAIFLQLCISYATAGIKQKPMMEYFN